MPNTVRNPTNEPSDRMLSLMRYTASTPPTSAIGSVRKNNVATRRLPKAACRSRKIPIAAMSAEQQQAILSVLRLHGLSLQLRVSPGGERRCP